MTLTGDQLHRFDQALTWLGVAGWALLLGRIILRRGVKYLLADPLRDMPLLAERLSPWSVLISLGFYLSVSMMALSEVERYFPPQPPPASVSTASASTPEAEPVLPKPDPLLRTAADSTAKLLTTLLMLLLLARGTSGGLVGAGLGLRHLGPALLLAVGGYVLVYPVCTGSAELVDWLLKYFAEGWVQPTHSVITILQDRSETGWAVGIAIFSAVVAAPLAEEIFFRGILQNVLVHALENRWVGIAITGVLFGVVHMGSTPQYALALAILGVWLGFLYQRFGSLWACILLHMLFNGVTVTLSLMSEAT